MTAQAPFKLIIIGERISPGYKSVRQMLETRDIAGIQALAVRQAEAGSSYLDVHLGPFVQAGADFVAEIVRGIQAAVSIPLCFDIPEVAAQEACLKAYDPKRAGGARPVVNSITEPRMVLMDLYKVQPFKVIVMASERLEDGAAKPNKKPEDVAATARRVALRLVKDYGMSMDDIFIDISVRAVIADTEGLNRCILEAIRLIRNDPELKGIHIMAAITNIGQQMPPKAVDGSNLKHALENAFLTIAVPNGLDAVMGTPWNGFHPLPEDDHVMKTYREFLQQSGTNALRSVRKLYRA